MTEALPTDETIVAPSGEPASEVLFGRYRVIQRLGEGGMGRVLRVWDAKVNEEVALKLIAPRLAGRDDLIERFRNELKLARKIAHRNVCRMYDFDKRGETPYITMEYVRGEELKSYIRRAGGRLDPDEAARIARGVCRGLAEAHRLGIVHRDLKPQNVMIDEEGEPRIMDFGLARSVASVGVTQLGTLVGTPTYMSPEQAAGEPVDGRSDLYSLGVLLFEMLAGEPPFKSDQPISLAMMHQTKPPPDLRQLVSDLPEGLAGVTLRLLEKSPERRFQTAGEVLTALETDSNASMPSLLSTVPPSFLAGDDEPDEPPDAANFAGREKELATLDARLEMARKGRLQVVFVTGEAGSGKSTLALEFARRAQQRVPDLVTAMGRCNAQIDVATGYEPFREVLGLLTGDVQAAWEAKAMGREQARRLWECAPTALAALVTLAPSLLDTFLGSNALLARASALGAAVAGSRQALLEIVERAGELPALNLKENEVLHAYAEVLREVARERVVLLLLDDLHWVDTGSVNLIFHLARKLEGSRVMMVGTFRKFEVDLGRAGERHPLEQVVNELKRSLGEIVVDLGSSGGRSFVDSYLDTEPNRLGPGFRDSLFHITQGHPLFTVELLRALQEKGSLHKDAEGTWVAEADIDWDSLPMRAEGVIAERLGRLPEELRELLDAACVEGEQFTAEAVARVVDRDKRQVVRALGRDLEKRHRLVKALGIQRVESRRLSQYRFRHILFQRFLYQELDAVERSYVHEDFARALEELYGVESDGMAARLAHHFEIAGIPEKAARYHHQAGAEAIRLSAYVESIPHLTRALELLGSLPASDDRSDEELALLSQLGAALTATRGYASDEVEEIYRRAQELTAQVDELPLAILWGIWLFHVVRGDWRSKEELRSALLKLEKAGDVVASLTAKTALAMADMLQGDQQPALERALEARELYDPSLHLQVLRTVGTELGLFAGYYVVWSAVLAGRLELALEVYEETLALAEEFGNAFNVAEVLAFGTTLFRERGEPERTGETAARLTELSREQNFPFWLACAQCAYGWTRAIAGEVEEGIEIIQEHLAIFQATGARVPYTLELAYLIESLLIGGRIEEGLAAVEEALTVADETRDRFYDAEIRRLKGDLLRASGDRAAAEEELREALRVASSQGAQSLALRAALSLVELLREEGRGADGEAALRAVYDLHPEGRDTPHLVRARELLGEAG